MQSIELEDGTRLVAGCECRGQVRRTKIMGQYVMNGYPAGTPICQRTEYECAVCGRSMYPDTYTPAEHDRALDKLAVALENVDASEVTR